MSLLVATTPPPKKIIDVNKIVTANCFDLSPEFFINNERHECWELYYVDSGHIISRKNDNEIKLSSGQIIFNSPGENHASFCDGHTGTAIFSMLFDSSSNDLAFFENKVLNVSGEAAFVLKRLINECSATYNVSKVPLSLKENAPIGGEQIILSYLEAFLILLMRGQIAGEELETIQTQDSGSHLLSESVCAYLQEHIYERVNLDMLSEHFHFGKVYLCHMFKKNVGCSIITYLTDLKITEAKRLLRESKLTVLEISDKLGFESPSYFSRCFKSRVGHSPQSFRKMLINDSMLKKRK